MNTLLKICGVKEPEFAREAEHLGFDLLGFIFHAPSPRNISVEKAKEIRGQVKCRTVGVFVNQEEKEIRRIAETVGLDVIQLHGAPDAELARNLRNGYEVWQAVSGECPADFPADAFLVDSPAPGSGRQSDWRLAERWIAEGRRVVLAGGLSAKNGKEALKFEPYALDFNSSLETEPGKKSIGKLQFLYRSLKK